MNAKYVIGSVIIVVFLTWGASAFFKTTVQYVSIQNAVASNRKVQVMGKIDFSRVNYNADKTRLEFAVFNPEDQDTISAFRMPVVYYGTVPGNFDQATSVVLKGQPNSEGYFVADQILVKCPSKYQGEDGEEYQDIQEDKAPTGV
ncbi:MAG: cytochrome c maturation protein CcmE [candidate division Zixibacteria bacterium]|nr:cytochrome c maturation protein CcmE [candidate division Zixibacteria bacterium]